MANRTQKDAKSVKGTNPQYLVEKIIRMRIYDSRFWKEECFALSAELIVDKAIELRYVGGIYAGNIKPAPFLCLTLKMLQIQPDKDIIIEFIRREDFKYVRALGAYYMRLTGTSTEIYKYLEPLYNDYRKLRWMGRDGKFSILHMDEFIDQLLREERVCDIQLPRLQKREYLEENMGLALRISALEEDLENLSASSSDDEDKKKSRKNTVDKLRRKKERERTESPTSRTRVTPPRQAPGNRDRRVEEERRDHERRREPREERREERRDDRRDDRRDRPERRDDDRDRRDDRSRRGERGERGDRERRDKDRDTKDRKRGREDSMDREIQEANELRAKLGIAPLK